MNELCGNRLQIATDNMIPWTRTNLWRVGVGHGSSFEKKRIPTSLDKY